MTKKLAGLFMVLWALQSSADIREIMRMEDILEHIDANTLVVLDLDNTVYEPEDNDGSDQDYYYLVKRFQEIDHLSPLDAHLKAGAIWNKMQYKIKTKPVEAIIPELIASLGTKVIALTARDPEIKDITRKQLLDMGIDFRKKAPWTEDLTLNINGRDALYTDGILFQGEGNNKGDVLVEFLHTIGMKFDTILFVDDRIKNTINVENALNLLPIKHIEFRYGATDEKVRLFNELPLDREYDGIGEYLSL